MDAQKFSDFEKPNMWKRLPAAMMHWATQIVLLSSMTAGERYRHAQWPILFAVFEPIGLVFLISFAQSYLFVTRPAFGSSNLLFNATGLIPYYLFVHVSQKVKNLDAMRATPHTTWIDQALAYLLGEIFVKTVILIFIFIALSQGGVADALPINPLGCLPPLLLLAIIGFSVGLFNLIIMSVWESWYYIYVLLVRALMAFSGVLFVMDYVPYQVREITAYNPIAQAITWFRENVYSNYPAKSLDLTYTFEVTAILLVFAILLEGLTREWRNIR